MVRGEAQRHAGKEASGLLFAELSAQRFFFVRIQIVEDEVYMDGSCMGAHAVSPQKICGDGRGSALSHLDGSLSLEWRNGDEDVARPVAFVLMIEAARSSRLRSAPAMRGGEQLLRRLVEAVHLVSFGGGSV